MSDRKKKDKKKKQDKSVLETELFALMRKGMKAALDAAMDDLFKAWK